MRLLAAAASILVCLFAAHVASPAPAGNAVRMVTPMLWAQSTSPKPASAAPRATDTCAYAHDNECDEPDIGTGVCAAATDYTDCRHLREGENDSCRFARDNECDEPNFGTGACAQGSDHSDCGDVAWMRNQSDSCASAFNGVYEEGENGRCAPRADRSDCHGRDRPLTIFDHFFGHDDRVLVNVRETPWRFMGQLHLGQVGTCTATLIGRDTLLTAAHCIYAENGRVNPALLFVSAGGERAQITHYLVDPRFNYLHAVASDDPDGADWALLRIDRPLGRSLGYARIQNLVGEYGQASLSADLMQAGYGWDTGDNLAGHLSCHVTNINHDNTFAHACDITRGDSGSALLIRSGRHYNVVGVVSSFQTNPEGPFNYIAVSSGAFEARVQDFVAGRSGLPINGRKVAPGAGNPPVVRRGPVV